MIAAEWALEQPFAQGSLLLVAAGLAEPLRQVVVVTADRSGPLARAARSVHADVIAAVTPLQATVFAEAGFALFEGKVEQPELRYGCRAFVCRLPFSDAVEVVIGR